jgi:drug/metabolite transporter (DMT)-like permease
MSPPPALDPVRRQTLIAISLTVLAYAIFNIGDAILKHLAAAGGDLPQLHFSQIVIVNCSFIIACAAIGGYLKDGKKAFIMQSPRLILYRAMFSATVGVLNVIALPHIKLTTFYTLVFTSPFWVALLAAFFLKEKLQLNRVLVILAGLATIAFVFRPGAGLFDKWAVMIVVGAFFYSCGLVVLRKMGPKESRTMLIIVGSFVSMLVVLPWFPFHARALSWHELSFFATMGVLSAISVNCIAYAFQTAPAASVVAPFHYTQIIWGALLGYYVFDEIPDDRVILGAAGIIAAGLYLIFSETRKKKPAKKTIDPNELPETAGPVT